MLRILLEVHRGSPPFPPTEPRHPLRGRHHRREGARQRRRGGVASTSAPMIETILNLMVLGWPHLRRGLAGTGGDGGRRGTCDALSSRKRPPWGERRLQPPRTATSRTVTCHTARPAGTGTFRLCSGSWRTGTEHPLASLLRSHDTCFVAGSTAERVRDTLREVGFHPHPPK